MTELDRARTYLQKQQRRLRCTRAMRPRLPAKIVDAAIAKIESDFLAALSWVWDAQERQRLSTPPVWFGWDLAKEAGGGSYSSPLPA